MVFPSFEGCTVSQYFLFPTTFPQLNFIKIYQHIFVANFKPLSLKIFLKPVYVFHLDYRILKIKLLNLGGDLGLRI